MHGTDQWNGNRFSRSNRSAFMSARAPLQVVPQQSPERRLELEEVLGDLVADRLVDRAAADALLAAKNLRRGDIHPLVLIANQKWKDPRNPRRLLTLDTLTEWLAGRVGLPYFRIDPFKVDFSAVTKVMSNAYATRFRILPVEVNAKEVVVATCQPHLREWEAELARALRLQVRRVLANPQDIETYQVEFYNLARSVKGASQQRHAELNDIANFEQLVELGRSGKLDANDQHIVHIVDWLLQYAFEQRASDIHLEPRRDSGNVRFRIDGVLHQVYQIPTPVMGAMVSRIKILGRMDVVEKRRPQDGRIKTRTADGDEIELRLSTMPTAFGEKLVMRIFSPDVLVKDFTELGFSEDEKRRWNALTAKPNGIVLVTGPTGSGKTTTLYSTLKQLALPDVNVCTIEDPIEMVEPQFNQMQVQAGIGLDFAAGVRTLMRQDPDIIMVGEIRDRETADMAIQAALTGHLVLSTLHTNDAPSAVTRLLDIGVEPYLLASTVLGILAQRLVRTFCPHCRQAAELEAQTWAWLTQPWQAPRPKQVYAAHGCLECRMTGYLGRVGVYELMTLTDAQRKLIQTGADLTTLREQAVRDGMRPLRLSGALKVAAGQTSVDEVLRAAPSPPDRRT
jgi:general secretion pathway protein E